MRKLLIFILLFTSTYCFPQDTKKIELHWSISEIFTSEGESIQTLSFDNATTEASVNFLPFFSENFKIGQNQTNYSVILEETVFENLSQEEIKLINPTQIPSDFDFQLNEAGIRKQKYLQIKFLPIRRNPSNGQLEKLKQFRIKLTSQTSQTRTKNGSKAFYANTSILSSGKWIKISVDTTAIHKISYQQLLDMGIENPASVRVYGSGGGMLPEMNNAEKSDDLILNPIYMSKGSDGVFNSGDYILFYAKGPRSWNYDNETKEFIHQNHLYSNTSHYFLTSDKTASPLIPKIDNELNPNLTVTDFDAYRVVDLDNKNLLRSGQLWFGQIFDITTSYTIPFYFQNLNTNKTISINTHVAGRSSSNTKFILSSNETQIGEINIPSVNTGSYTATYASQVRERFDNFKAEGDQFNIKIKYEKGSASSIGWLDYMRLNARCQLIFEGEQLAFRDTRSIGPSNIASFKLKNANPNTVVWDVTQASQVKQIARELNGSTAIINVPQNELRELIAFDLNSKFPSPKYVGVVQNQNLHGLSACDLIIVSHPDFLSYANQLAELHKNQDQLKVSLVSTESIYNEFSSGTVDAAAIRNFVKMFYDRATSEDEMPKYLLLFGDGSYDNKLVSSSNTNKIPTYQSSYSLSPTQSFVTDDFFGLLDDNEGGATGLVDIGIGRLPVNSSEEARIVTSKILNYNKNENLGSWQTSVCFIGDDEDNNVHMRDANKLAMQLENNNPKYRIHRIFLDAFKQETTPAGDRYPAVNRKIEDNINKGCLIVNYTGHGNENGLAHEKIMMTEDIESWKNEKYLPLFMTATCEFSRFDQYQKRSAGESILLRDNGGGIGLFTTTRLVFSTPNFYLNQNFYNYVFSTNNQNESLRLGDIMRLTKNASGSSNNKRNFTLLGDPALKLNYPTENITTLKLNTININQATDTLKALRTITLSGQIENQNSQKLNQFNGILFATVFDKFSDKTTLGNDGIPFEYREQNNALYSGKASIKNGEFSFSFLVPKDINPEFGKGKIQYYAKSTTTTASGYTNDIIVGGSNINNIDDKLGPEIDLYMNDEQFVNGGATSESPLLLAIVQDSSGINTLGVNSDHNIIATIDKNTDNNIELNDHYQTEIDSYQKGRITYQLSNFKEGEHQLNLKIWDNLNNPSESEIDFVVAENAKLAIKHLLNYPNPFTTHTGFYFEHNQASGEIEVLIQILTISGKLVKTIETSINSSGFRVGPINWDGTDDFGDNIGRGVYFYRVKLRTEDGKTANKFQKLVILK
ncbi:type IX secretion system sortase PorU [Ancylomarina salipaludis]|uniref:Type IX secretion system sortase PorU n=1 Tax=Ancylomarina salipaludis TaxID=2501299 RepID=A0A4Q1JS95_9BACT|nr:type IX secretion system sortase PorU [Ancylomarina salipaludis]RXQ97665.1 type IX secretion system sortase PorU [Ancylomarina salipaludis]